MHATSEVPQAIAARLLRDEAVLWFDRPAQGLRLGPHDTVLIPFSLLWGGFAIFWELTVLRGTAPAGFALFGLPFVAVGLFLIFGRFLLDAWLRGRMLYALTDRRALIVRTGPWPSLKAVSLEHLPETSLNESADGRGTIRFGASASVWGGFNGRAGSGGAWVPALDPTPQFLAVEDAQRVFAAIQERSAGRPR